MRRPGTGGVFKRQWRTRDGKLKKSECWYYWFVDSGGKQHQRQGCTDKDATTEALQKVRKEVRS